MKSSELLRLASFEREAADFILNAMNETLRERGNFRLGLAGGTTPAAVYEQLAIVGQKLPWSDVQITFGDERCVPPQHPDSNYKMAHHTLLGKVPVPRENVLRMRGETEPESAALEYEQRIQTIAARYDETRYRHDLLLLGIGPDGHTASLFPGSPSLRESERNIIATIGPKPPPQRLTMTLPLINAARHVCFLVKDRAKESVVDAIRNGDMRLPAAHVQPSDGLLTWVVAS